MNQAPKLTATQPGAAPEGLGLLLAGVALWTVALWSFHAPYLARAETPWMAAACLALGMVALLAGTSGAVWTRLLACALVGVQLVALDASLVRWEAAGAPDVALIGRLASYVLRPFIATAEFEGGVLLVDLGNGARGFTPSSSLLATRALVEFVLCSISVAFCLRREGHTRLILWLILSTSTAATLRFALEALAFQQSEAAITGDDHIALALFWNPWSLLAQLLAVAWVVGSAVRSTPRPTGGGRLALLVLPLVASGVALGTALGWSQPALSTGHRVLVDDRLSGIWEPATRLLTKDRFGDFSTYSFASFVEHLSHRFAVSVNPDRAYDRELLDDFDVLVLKTPHEQLGAEEVMAIQEWVADGGGLFAIGDHTDLNGMNTNLNEVVSPMGLTFRNDSMGKPEGEGFLRWQDRWLPEHPISAGMESFGFMTGCSLELSKGARPVMSLPRSVSKRGDYSQSSHFGKGNPEPADQQGVLVASAAVEFGAGRAVAFGDSTVFSSFAYFSDSHADYSLRVVTWLAQKPLQIAYVWPLLVGIGFLGILLVRRSLWEGDPRTLLCSGVLVSIGFLFGYANVLRSASTQLSTPSRSVETVDVGFVVEGGRALLPPVLGPQPDEAAENFMTFFMIPARLGQEPRMIQRDASSLDELEILVLINPDAEADPSGIPSDWLESVRTWGEAGGRLIVLSQGKHLEHDHLRSSVYFEDVDFRPQHSGVPEIGLTYGRRGLGSVYHVTTSERLSVIGMGHCMAYPHAEQRALYDLAYLLFGSDGLGRSPEERKTYIPVLGAD